MFSSDTPINLLSEDEFGVGRFIERLIGPVLRAPANQSLVVGLYAPWGHGKTSALNLLAKFLTATAHQEQFDASKLPPQAIVVRFNPWLYADVEALLVSFFETMAAELGGSYSLSKEQRDSLTRALRGMGRFVGPALAVAAAATTPHVGSVAGSVGAAVAGGAAGALVVPPAATAATAAGAATVGGGVAMGLSLLGKLLEGMFGGAAEWFAGGEATFRKRRDEAAKVLRGMGQYGRPIRAVVLVDDVDRADGPEILATLKLIKLVADLPNVSYVLAMDDVRVRDVLAAQTSSAYGASFLEKIVQVPVRLPPVDPDRLRELVLRDAISIARGADSDVTPLEASGYGKLGSQHTYDRLLGACVRTPRDRARLINLYRFALLTDDGPHLHVADLLLLCALQAFYPDVYTGVLNNAPFLLRRDPAFSAKVPGATRNEQVMHSIRKRHIAQIAGFESYPDDPASHASRQSVPLRIVEHLFGDVVSERPTTDWTSSSRARATGRIASPERFDGYFTLQRAADDVPSQIIERAWNVLVSDAAPADIVIQIAGLIERLTPGQRRTVWNRLDDRASLLKPDDGDQVPDAERLAAVLPAIAADPVVDSSTRGVQMLAHQAVAALHTAAARSALPGSGQDKQDEAARLRRVSEELVLQLIERLPAPDAAEFAHDWARAAPELRARFSPDVSRRIAAAGLARIADFVEGFSNVFTEYRPDEPSAARHLLWHWRKLAGLAGTATEGDPDARLANYLGGVLEAEPMSLSDVLALAGWLTDDLRISRHASEAEVLTPLREMYDLERIRALTMEAVERGEAVGIRWPALVQEMAAKMFTAPSSLEGDTEEK